MRLILITLLFMSLLGKPTNAEEIELITEIKRGEEAPFSGVLLPIDEFYQYEKAQRGLDYMLNNPPPTEECEGDVFTNLLLGALVGILAGVSLSR